MHLELIKSWLESNPPAQGSGWEPYPLSLRIINWIKWHRSGNPLSHRAQQSLAVQVRWLAKRIEWHILGNHLFVNAKALIFASSFFDGPEAEEWLKIGTDILRTEIPEQILSDGGHFELSPMYHSLCLEDILDLINILRTVQGTWSAAAHSAAESVLETTCTCVPKMLCWLQTMSHPDEKIAFFNDSAFGIAPETPELRNYAAALGFEQSKKLLNGVMWLSASGYARIEREHAVLIADMAEVGARYIPGHAHADTLSFELSLFNQRVFVNSGTSEYGVSVERLRQRGTAAHNTVLVDKKNSSEIWSGFRVGRRAYVANISIEEEQDTLLAAGSQDGYQRLYNGPIHSRVWKLGNNSLTIEDELSIDSKAEARYHLHPAVQIFMKERLLLPNGNEVHFSCGDYRVETCTWHPEFGSSVNNYCIIIPVIDKRAKLCLSWRSLN